MLFVFIISFTSKLNKEYKTQSHLVPISSITLSYCRNDETANSINCKQSNCVVAYIRLIRPHLCIFIQ